MYIIETFRGEIKIDADEVIRLATESDKKLIFFRQGAVNPNQIVRVIEDTARKQDVLKLAGESAADYQKRLDEEKSPDIFGEIRAKMKTLPANIPKQLT